MSTNTCVCCGAIIPEGRQVCPICERQMIYPCDPEKNTTCTKQSCFVNGGPCCHTTNPEFKRTTEKNRVAPCVACRYSERIRRNKLMVFCQLRGVEVPILHTCENGDRKTEKEIQRITNHYKTERNDKK